MAFGPLFEAAQHSHGAVGLVIASLLFVAAVSWVQKDKVTKSAKIDPSNKSNSGAEETVAKTPKIEVEEPIDTNVENESRQKAKAGGDGLRNVFSVKQRPIATGNGSRSSQTSSEKPFESSYYFAHNKHSTGGGYKDGLRAEDYVMNGPKLLTKGGVRVDDVPKIDTSGNDPDEECMQSKSINAKERPKTKSMASTPITKYMWDDDGSTNVAKIHIDSLPSSSTKTIKWQSAGITKEQVEVRLIGENNEGLYTSVVTQQGKRYQLHIPKMYGEAESIKFIVKKHKLLIKIQKKKIPKIFSSRHSTGEGFWTSARNILGRIGGDKEDKEEFTSVAWPRLSASSTGGFAGGKVDINEKLFKEMDVEKNVGSGDIFDM